MIDEKNLQEKNLQSEKLDDEELDQVAGGVGTADENNSSEGLETGINRISGTTRNGHGAHWKKFLSKV